MKKIAEQIFEAVKPNSEKFLKGQHGLNTVFEFSTKDEGIYVESFDIEKKVKYQAITDDGEELTELEDDLDFVVREAMKHITKMGIEASKKHKHRKGQ